MENRKERREMGQSLVSYILPCGMKCYIIPKKEFQEKQAMLCVNYGSMDTEFLINGIKYATPEGIAHFLEHKMFEDENRNLFDEFNALEANVNAYTNYNMTAYHYNCRNNFYENLELLLDLVFQPYFTEENVDKEKDIIVQEIKMYKDVPSWRIFFNMQSKLYQKLPLNKDIAGTEDSVRSIDKDMLYLCYNSFYNPQNMALICTGDVDELKINAICEKKIQNKEKFLTEKIYGTENDFVSSDYVEEQMNVASNIFNVGFKDSNEDKNKLSLMNSTRLALDLIFGESSDFYDDLYREGLIDGSFSCQYVSSFSYGTTILSGTSKDPEKLRECIFTYVDRYLSSGVSEERFEQIKKKQIGQYIRNFNSIDVMSNVQADLYLKDLDLIDIIDNLRDIKMQDITARIQNHFRKDNQVLSVIKPLPL